MTWFDIVVLAILGWCLISGWRSGILVELSGIAGILLGAWAAYHFSHAAGGWLGLENVGTEVLFVVILLAVMVCVVLLCLFITKVLKAAKLALPVRILGGLFAAVKGLLIMALAVATVESVCRSIPAKVPESISDAASYRVLHAVGSHAFPYLVRLGNSAFDAVRN